MPIYTKISQLPSASTLQGTELLETVQGGVNCQLTASQILAFAIAGYTGAGAAAGQPVQALFGKITQLSSGAGTLSGIATANGATPLGVAVLFSVAGLPQGWYLAAATGATASGVQRPDDYNASTNQRNWVQFL